VSNQPNATFNNPARFPFSRFRVTLHRYHRLVTVPHIDRADIAVGDSSPLYSPPLKNPNQVRGAMISKRSVIKEANSSR
jgi:hypothetical protein